MSTRPATLLRVVVLPAPEGPSTTKNSPSPNDRVMPSTAVIFPYRLVMFSISTVAIRPSPPRRRARGREVVVGLAAAAEELRHRDGHRGGRAVGEDQREDVVVPGEDEREQRRGGDARAHQRQSHHDEPPLARVAVE